MKKTAHNLTPYNHPSLPNYEATSFVDGGICNRQTCLNPGSKRGVAAWIDESGKRTKTVCQHCYSVVYAPSDLGYQEYNPAYFSPNSKGGHGFCSNGKRCLGCRSQPAQAVWMKARSNKDGITRGWLAECDACKESTPESRSAARVKKWRRKAKKAGN